jgi:hypothetical protein
MWSASPAIIYRAPASYSIAGGLTPTSKPEGFLPRRARAVQTSHRVVAEEET